jgi:hypothetical protein
MDRKGTGSGEAEIHAQQMDGRRYRYHNEWKRGREEIEKSESSVRKENLIDFMGISDIVSE